MHTVHLMIGCTEKSVQIKVVQIRLYSVKVPQRAQTPAGREHPIESPQGSRAMIA